MQLDNLPKLIKKIVEQVRPDLSSYMRFPVQGAVTGVNAATYTVDVEPDDEAMAPLPKVQVLTPWATSKTRIVFLPAVGDQVIVGFENGDHRRPFIEGFLTDSGPEGYFLLESDKARVKIGNDGTIEIISGTIQLGEGSLESLVKGETLKRLFDSHQHIGNKGAPTSKPIVPLANSALSQVTKTQ